MGQGIDLGRGGLGYGQDIDLGRGGQGFGHGVDLRRGGLGGRGFGRGGKKEVKFSLENTGFKGDFEISDIKAGRDKDM